MRARMAMAVALCLVMGAISTADAGPVASVTVKDAGTGAGLSKALVVAIAGTSVVATKTDANGKASVALPGTKKATLIAARNAYVTHAQTVTWEQSAKLSLTFELHKHTSEDFKQRGRIVGFVRDSEGKALPTATLVLLTKKGEETVPVGATQPENATGLYELSWYKPGTYTVLATAPGYAMKRYQAQRITAGESLWLDVVLQKK